MKELHAECQQIQEFLEITTSDDPNELVARLTDINVYMARTGKILADVQRLKNDAILHIHNEYADRIKSMPPSLAKKFIEANSLDENYLVGWVGRLNSTCVHQSENLRTQISYAKENLRLTKQGY